MKLEDIVMPSLKVHIDQLFNCYQNLIKKAKSSTSRLVNHKTAGGKFESLPCCFSKNLSSAEMVKPLLFCGF